MKKAKGSDLKGYVSAGEDSDLPYASDNNM